MSNRLPKDGAVDPDGIPITIRWDLFNKGTSVFIPCINTTVARKQMHYIATKLGMTVKVSVVIERGKYGIRAWRTR